MAKRFGKVEYKRWVPIPENIVSHGGLLPGLVATLSPAALRMLIYVAGTSRGAEIEISNADLMKFAALNRFNIQKARAELQGRKLLRVTRIDGDGLYRYRVCEPKA